MCVCMCVCVCRCVCMCMSACVCMCVCVCVHVYMCMCACAHTSICLCMLVHVCVCACRHKQEIQPSACLPSLTCVGPHVTSQILQRPEALGAKRAIHLALQVIRRHHFHLALFFCRQGNALPIFSLLHKLPRLAVPLHNAIQTFGKHLKGFHAIFLL